MTYAKSKTVDMALVRKAHVILVEPKVRVTSKIEKTRTNRYVTKSKTL